MFPFNNQNRNEENENNENTDNLGIFDVFVTMTASNMQPFSYSRGPSIRDMIFGRMMQAAMMEVFEEQLEDYITNEVIRRSLDESKEIERTKPPINFTAQRYDTLSKKQQETTECSICLVEYEKADMVSITKCNHIFHNKCIEEWSHYKHDCPVCRKDLEGSLKDDS